MWKSHRGHHRTDHDVPVAEEGAPPIRYPGASAVRPDPITMRQHHAARDRCRNPIGGLCGFALERARAYSSSDRSAPMKDIRTVSYKAPIVERSGNFGSARLTVP